MASGTSCFSSWFQVQVGRVALQGLRFKCGPMTQERRLKFMLFCIVCRRADRNDIYGSLKQDILDMRIKFCPCLEEEYCVYRKNFKKLNLCAAV